MNPSESSRILPAPAGAPDSPESQRLRRLWSIALVWVVLLLAALAISTSVLFVDETEFVIVERLGQIVAVYDNAGSVGNDRGMHLKLPWPIATARRFDRRQQLFDPPGREMFTREKKNITISSFVCWKIADPPAGDVPLIERPVVRFFRGLGNIATAEDRLETRVRSALSAEIGRSELGELLVARNSDAAPGATSPLADVAGRALNDLRHREGEESLARLGIELVDVRIKRINLPEGNRAAVYERMRAERARIAESYRSEGFAEKSRIESQARRQSEELLARADADAARIKGEGEAEAIRILNQAHAQDPEFYEFERTLATYAKILNERTTLVLSAGSRLFKLLVEGVPDPSTANSGDSRKWPLPAPSSEAPNEAPRNNRDDKPAGGAGGIP